MKKLLWPAWLGYNFCLVAHLVGLEPREIELQERQIAYPWGLIGLFDGLQELFGHLQSPCEVGRSGRILNRIHVIFACEGLLVFAVLRHLD